MPPPAKKRDIADFFKPYARGTVPQKRPSPSAEEEVDSRRPTASPLTTPVIVSRFRDVAATKSPSSAIQRDALTPLPIRSPARHPAHQSTPTPQSASRHTPLFKTRSKAAGSALRPATSFTFADAPTSSRKVVREGKVIAVRDSDEENDTDSLASLDDILGRRKDEPQTDLSSPPDVNGNDVEQERTKLLSSFTRGRPEPLIGKQKLQSLIARQREPKKLDISKLLGDHVSDQKGESNIAKAQAGYEASEMELEMGRQLQLDRNLLASIVRTNDGNQDDISRLMNAVERTEALTYDESYSFFGREGLNDWREEAPMQHDFPDGAVPDDLWAPRDSRSRSRAYLSGYMADLAATASLADDALTWSFENVVLESHDEVRDAYINCVQHGSGGWTRTHLTAQHVQEMFQTLGADMNSINDGGVIEIKQQPLQNTRKRDYKYLLAALKLFGAVCQDMDFVALSKLASIACRLALDARVMSEGQVSDAVQDLLARLLDLSEHEAQSHVSEHILLDMVSNNHEPLLQARLLNNLLPTSPTAACLRVVLAHCFLLDLSPGETDSKTISLDRLTRHVSSSPLFETTLHSRDNPVDYEALTSRAQILDVAVADGGRPVSFSSRAEEVAFNRSVDALADHLKTIFSSIADSGASHMRRTEAKDALQTIHHRLLFAVRTEVRLKKHIFDPETGKNMEGDMYRSEEKTKGFMAKFLAKQRERQAFGSADVSTSLVLPNGSQSSDSEAMIRQQLGLS